jgi:hypothetical protein
MKISEAISLLRIRLGSMGYDDDQLSDEACFKLISDSAAIVFHRYRERYFAISPWMYSTYGIKLEMVDEDFFPCEDIERCKVLQSVFNIPEPLMSRNSPLIKVYQGKKEIVEYSSSNKYDELLSTKASWEVVNQKLRIHNTTNLKGIIVKTIPLNVMDWYDKKYCPETNTVECFDLDEIEMPLLNDGKFSGMCYDIVLQQLNIPLQEGEKNPSH